MNRTNLEKAGDKSKLIILPLRSHLLFFSVVSISVIRSDKRFAILGEGGEEFYFLTFIWAEVVY